MRRALVLAAVLGVALLLFYWPFGAPTPIVETRDDTLRCNANLREVYAGLSAYHQRFGRLPQRSGPAFLWALIADGIWPDTPASRARLTCPGTNAEPVPEELDPRAALTGAASAYAARDVAAFPLAKFPSGGVELEPLAACDNARGLNHEGAMNVLYSDGSVRTLLLAQEIERGHLAAGATTIPVGKDSPIADLAKLAAE